MISLKSLFPSNHLSSESQSSRAFTKNRFYVLVGSIVVFMLILAVQNFWDVAPLVGGGTSIEQRAEAAAALSNSQNQSRSRVEAPDQRNQTFQGRQQKQPLSSSQLSLKIMTFNLRNNGTDDRWNNWDYRKDFMADIIDRYHPAIMGTQEGLKAQLTDLKSLLKHPYERFGIEREENGEFEQIFYDPAMLERLDDGNFWLSEQPDTPWTQGWDAACVRMVTWGKFRLRATQQELLVFNTQLDHMGPQSRTEGSKLIWERIQRIAGDAPLFLLGDFNVSRTTSTYSYLTSQEDGPHFRDAWPDAEEQIGNVSNTFHDWAGVNNDEEKTGVRAANHIDWIMYRPQMRVLTTEVIIENRNGRYPSDHFPVQTEVLFPSPAELPPPRAS